MQEKLTVERAQIQAFVSLTISLRLDQQGSKMQNETVDKITQLPAGIEEAKLIIDEVKVQRSNEGRYRPIRVCANPDIEFKDGGDTREL